MSKSTKKTRKCQQCGFVVRSASLELLLDHMESVPTCKEAIKICDACLMKFPDEASLLKHMSLKKQCLDTYNMGLMDPTLVINGSGNPESDKDAICHISFLLQQASKRKKSDSIHVANPNPFMVTNGFSTYAFPLPQLKSSTNS